MENFELTLDWANRDLFSIFLGILAGILIFWIGRWFAKLTTRYASCSMERAHVLELADSSVNLAVRSWVQGEDYWQVRSDLLEQINLRFDETGINIPYPQQDIHLYQSSPET